MTVYRLVVPVLCLMVIRAFAQDPAAIDLSFNPADTGYGEVRWFEYISYDIMEPLPDGGFYAAISYDYPDWSHNIYLFRFLENGELDPGFALNAYGPVYAMALQPDGKLLVGMDEGAGNFAYDRNLLRLNPDGSIDSSFVAYEERPNGHVTGIVVDQDSSILVYGYFSMVGDSSRGRLVRLDPDGNVTQHPYYRNSFPLAFSLEVNDVCPLADGSLIVTDRLNGNYRVIRYRANGIQDPGFQFNEQQYSEGSLAPTADGMGFLYTGLWDDDLPFPGALYRFDTTATQVGPPLAVYNSGGKQRIDRLSNGNLLLSYGLRGDTLGYDVFDVMMLDSSGTLVHWVDPLDMCDSRAYGLQPREHVKVAVDPYDRVLLSSMEMSLENGSYRPYTVRFLADGRMDTTFRPVTGANGRVNALQLLPDGRMVIGGEFTSFNGQPTRRLARLHDDGSVDTSFHVGSGAHVTVNALLRKPNGELFVGLEDRPTGMLGGGGTGRNGFDTTRITGTLLRLSSTGALLEHHTMPWNDAVLSLTPLSTGGQVLAGLEDDVERLHPNGALDSAFANGNGPNDRVFDAVELPNGNYMIGGEFDYYNGTSVNPGITRITPTGSLAGMPTSFFNAAFVRDLDLLPGGDCLVCG
ncbi:MAG: hypothetical protein KDC03_18520, partial [Flavobacteriales bacterium]|nr:hypothetical protein [Flavobacteriales bacterium]